MKSNSKKIKELLQSVGIKHRMNGRVKPSKHPYLSSLEVALIDREFQYKYFLDSDSIVILGSNNTENEPLYNTMIIPSISGVSVIVVCGGEEINEDRLIDISSLISDILPRNLCFDILGMF